MIIGIHTKKEKRKKKKQTISTYWKPVFEKVVPENVGSVTTHRRLGARGGPGAFEQPGFTWLGGNVQAPLLSILTLPLPLKQILSI